MTKSKFWWKKTKLIFEEKLNFSSQPILRQNPKAIEHSIGLLKEDFRNFVSIFCMKLNIGETIP